MNAQQLIIGHLLPITVAIAVFWLVYRLLFVNSNRLRFNRFFLLTAMLLSLALPLMGTLMGNSAPQVVTLKENLFKGTLLNEITITSDGQMPVVTPEVVVETASRQHFNLWQILGGLYIIGVGVMTLLFLIKLGKLVVLIARSPKEKRDGYTAVFTGREQGSFSFLRYAIFPSKDVSPDIVRHERSHISHHHSADLLFAEIMMILQWFNPFVYKYKKELQSLHEYQADRDVVATGVDKRDYMMLILQQCTAADFSGMSNNFSLILTKKRIKMITRNEKAKGLWWRLLATLPVLAILMIANTKVTAQEQQPDKQKIKVEINQFEIFDDNGNPMNLTDTIIYNEDGSYVQFKTTEASDPITGEMRNKITATCCNADGTPNKNIKFTLNAIEKHGDTTMYTVEPFTLDADNFRLLIQTTEENPAWALENKNDTIYDIVDQMPKFPGGETAMMEFIGKNVKYPQKAKDEGIQGRVFIQFVVEKDGSIGEVKLLRGIGGGCDEEGIRVVKSMPKWKPGKQNGEPVRVYYTIPIFFKLTDGTTSKNGLVNSTYMGKASGTKEGATYTMKMDMVFESEKAGYFVMTLTTSIDGRYAPVFEDVGLPFTYTFDGKSSGSIQPTNPDGSQLGEKPAAPYGFLLNQDGSILVHFYDFKEDIGIGEIIFKKVEK